MGVHQERCLSAPWRGVWLVGDRTLSDESLSLPAAVILSVWER